MIPDALVKLARDTYGRTHDFRSVLEAVFEAEDETFAAREAIASDGVRLTLDEVRELVGVGG